MSIDELVCGCPAAAYDEAGHRAGCWLADADRIADLAAQTAAAVGGNAVVAVVVALADAGHLRSIDAGLEPDAALHGLLDALAEQGLLGPAVLVGGAR